MGRVDAEINRELDDIDSMPALDTHCSNMRPKTVKEFFDKQKLSILTTAIPDLKHGIKNICETGYHITFERYH